MAFDPQNNGNVEITVGDTPVNVAIDPNFTQCVVYNAGPDMCHVKYGFAAVPFAAGDTDMVMPSGLRETHTKGYKDTISAKCRSGKSCTLHIIVGSGD